MDKLECNGTVGLMPTTLPVLVPTAMRLLSGLHASAVTDAGACAGQEPNGEYKCESARGSAAMLPFLFACLMPQDSAG
eukprot:1180485-Prorocentrum_minimum.AAC.2